MIKELKNQLETTENKKNGTRNARWRNIDVTVSFVITAHARDEVSCLCDRD